MNKKVNENEKNTKKFESHRQNFVRKSKKMIKKFVLILITLCMINNIAFAATDTDTTSGDSLYAKNMLKDYKPNVYSAVDLTCRGIVAKTSSGVELKTQITDFDIEKGITYCQIYKKDNPDFILNINADAQWQVIKDAKLNEYEKDKITTKIESMSSSIGKNTGNSSSGDTLSTFLVKTVLLMDNSGGSKGTVVTEYDASDLTQTWNNSSGFKETATNMLSSLWENIKTPFKYIGSKVGIDTEIATKELKVPYVASASDGFDAYNIAYYRALFNGMNSVYIHLQKSFYYKIS